MMKVLEGIKVIDFTQAYSGPFCTLQLADFGAEVIKIERRGIGDQSREWTPFKNGHSGYYAAINRNKKGISLDIASDEGREIILDMVKDADVIVQNFKVGTLDKFGLGYDEIKKVNPGIIYASISGFGQTGPLSHLAAYDNVVQAMTGVMEMTGFPDGVPTKVGPAIGDNFTGIKMANAIMMALIHKMNTGEGQQIDVAMFDTIFSILESPILFETVLGQDSNRTGNADPATLVPYDVYQCKDGYFSAGIASDSGYPKFCEAINMPELISDERFKTNEDRCRNYRDFTDIVSMHFEDKTRSELANVFIEFGVPNAPVMDIPEIMEHPQIVHREMMVDFQDPGVGEHKAINNPMKLSKTPAQLSHGAPVMGQDTVGILRNLGYDDSKIQELHEREVI